MRMKENIFKRKIHTVINNPKSVIIKVLYFISPLLADKLYLKILFRLRLGHKLDLKNPTTYNEKLQWLKLYYRKPIMTKMVDKYEAKQLIKDMVGEQYVVKNYGVWNTFDEIDFNSLPSQFVLKTTHDQGGVVMCKDKSKFDFKNARKKLNKHLKRKHFYLSREWPYKDVSPRILAEEFLNSKGDMSFKDYKFYCFNGTPKIMYVSMGKEQGRMTFDYYDMDFNLFDIQRPSIPNSGVKTEKPEDFELMIQLAKIISSNFPHVRVDFYEIQGKVYVGELTFFQGGGLMPFIPEKWDTILGNWIDLNF